MRFIRPLLLAAVALVPVVAPAQEEEPPRFAVEVILFLQPEAGAGEWWPQRAPAPDAQRLGALQSDAVRALPASDFELVRIRNALEASPGYQVLGHIGWIQPGWDRPQAEAVVLPLEWSPPAAAEQPFAFVPADTRLLGTIRVYRGRFLHVRTDLRYYPRGVPARPQLQPVPGSDPVTGLTTRLPAHQDDGLIVYPIVQERRISSDDLHYLDHPALGMLIEVRRYPSE
jgi:hypothetical protein